jgi:DNA-binding XRE family transcriptional regulator
MKEGKQEMKSVRDIMAELPKDRQARINARAKELIAEEMTLQSLRKAHRKTQKAMAAQLGIGQDSVSRLEQRTDMLLSTLREYVAAMGGKIRLLAEFKGAAPIELSGIGALEVTKVPRRKRRTETRRRPTKPKAA